MNPATAASLREFNVEDLDPSAPEFAEEFRAILFKIAHDEGLAARLLRNHSVPYMKARAFVLEFPKIRPSYLTMKQLLEELYIDAHSETWVQDDLFLFETLEYQLEESHDLCDFKQSDFNPLMLQRLMKVLENKELMTSALCLGRNIWPTMLAKGSQFLPMVSPCKDSNEVNRGFVGKFLGIPMYTDAFRNPRLRVMEPNDIWCFPPKQFAGEMYTGMPEHIKIDENPITVNWTVQRRQRVRSVNTSAIARMRLIAA